jgi:hypothetical protein
MKDGAIVANSGHFNVELDLDGLNEVTISRREIRDFVEEFHLKNGRKLYLLGEGRLINLASAEGHPSSVMDMSFANQALAAEYLVRNHRTLAKKVYQVPGEIDSQIARIKLQSMNEQDVIILGSGLGGLINWDKEVLRGTRKSEVTFEGSIEFEGEGIRISGYASLPSFSKGNASGIYLYVNQRFVKDPRLLCRSLFIWDFAKPT